MSSRPGSLSAEGTRFRGGALLPANAVGLTLIELMVVIALLVGLMGAATYSLGIISQSEMKNEAMRLTSSMQYTWSRAAMNNAQYRMVFDLDEGSYRTEVTDAPVIQKEDSEDESGEFISEEAREAQEKEQEEQSGPFQTKDKDPFNVDKKPTYETIEDSELKPHKLRAPLKFDRVIPCNREEPITQGKAAIHFFPNGFQEPAIIVLSNGEESYYSLKTEPLTGRVKIYSKRLEKTEDCGKPQEVQDEW